MIIGKYRVNIDDNTKEVNSDSDFEDDDLEDQEEEEEEVDPEDVFDFEAWEEEQYEREIEADSQRHLDWLYNTK